MRLHALVLGGAVSDAVPRWSCDGKRVAFSRTVWLALRCDVEGVWTIKTDGTGAVGIVEERTGLAWSPDGKRLLVETRGGLALFTPAGASVATLVARGAEPAWQPLPPRSALFEPMLLG